LAVELPTRRTTPSAAWEALILTPEWVPHLQ
jgi:hypothetical protein